MPKHDLSRVKVNTNVVDPLAETAVQKSPDPAIAELRMRYYDPRTNEPISFEQLERRIQKTADRISRLSVEMMFDLYFAHANWTGFYNRTDSFRGWLERTVDISRSYAYDIIKVVRTMIEYVGETGSERPMLPIEEIGTRIEEVGLRKMKLIAQVHDQRVRAELLQQVFSGASVADDDIIQRNRETIDAIRRNRGSTSESRVQVSLAQVRSVVTRLQRELKDDGDRRIAVVGGLQALSQAFRGTPIQSEIDRILDRSR